MKWKLVPVEPTEAMVEVGEIWTWKASSIYDSMLAAAPSAADNEERVTQVARALHIKAAQSGFWSHENGLELARAAIKAMEEDHE